MGILYIISILIIIVSFILRKKTEKEIDILGFICISIVLLFCYNTFICYILTFFAIPIKLWILSIINVILSIILLIPVIKKRDIQKYTLKKIDIIYMLLIIIVVLAVSYLNFGFPFEINYISADPSHHYLTSIKFAKEDALMPNTEKDLVYGDLSARKPVSYVNSGLLMKSFCSDLDSIEDTFNIFAGFGIFTLSLIGLTIYTGIKKYAKKREHTFWAFLVSLICTLGYPLNSLLFGFEYLTMGLLVICAIINLVDYYEKNTLKLSYIMLMFGLLNFGLFFSYYMFVPFVYPALWIYFCIKNHSKTNKIITKELVLILIVTLLLPFVLGYIYHLAPNIYSIVIDKYINPDEVWDYSSYIAGEGLATYGFIYINLYSNMLLLIPLTIYLIIKDHKISKLKNNTFLALLLLFILLFIELLFIGNSFGKVSIYYLSKNYFALWIIFAYTNYKALILLSEEKGYKHLSRIAIYGYVFLMILCTTFSHVKIIESTVNPYENIFSVMEVFGANKTLAFYKPSEFNEDEIDIIQYVKDNIDLNSKIEIVSDHRTYFWAYVLLGNINIDEEYKENHGGQGLLGAIWNDLQENIHSEETDYIVYFNRSKKYKMLKDKIPADAEKIYENEYGGILKYD